MLCWDGDESGAASEKISAIRRATDRFENALREAREQALGERQVDRRLALQVKDRIAKPYAPFAWCAIQLVVGASLVSFTGYGDAMAATADASPPLIVPIAIGVAFAPLLSALRRERWRRQPGVEDGEGGLERLLVDAQLGSYALPAPWEWRASEPMRWGLLACAAESLAALNVGLCWHAGVQQGVETTAAPLVGDGAAALLAALTVASCGAGRAAYFFDEVRDGLPAELEAARRLNATAPSYYYGMTSASADEAALSTRAIGALTAAWTTKFAAVAEDDSEARFSQYALSFAHAGMCALLWELAGRSLLAPTLALALAAADVYVLRPDTEQSRARIKLDAVLASERP